MPVFRSLLFAPANHARRVDKALGLDADGVILDLEDAVAVAEKPAARADAAAALVRPRTGPLYVRVNAASTPFCHADIQAVAAPGLDGIVIPKIESADELRTIDWLIGQIEGERGLTRGAIDLIAIIETGRGLARVQKIAAAGTRVRRLAFGAGDFTADVGIAWSPDEAELAPYRAAIVVASRAAGLEPPVDTVWVDLKNAGGFAASCRRARAMGFQGKLCIHPDQVGAANAAFAPSERDVTWSRRVIAAFAEAEKAGHAAIQLEGQFIDYPIVERARRVVATADAIAQKTKRQETR